MKSYLKRLNSYYSRKKDFEKLGKIYHKYADYTMIPKAHYIDNLMLARKVLSLSGDVVECGVWRGGMSAGMAEILGNKYKYYLFDSFEGLPEAKEIDGKAAKQWQDDTKSPGYYDNCKAEIDFAEKAMKMTHVNFECVKGWFDKTIPGFDKVQSISLLRLDGDWYDSTMVCLENFFPKVVENGLVLIDDYYTWSGCSRAVHDYLAATKSPTRIYSSPTGVAYMVKQVQD